MKIKTLRCALRALYAASLCALIPAVAQADAPEQGAAAATAAKRAGEEAPRAGLELSYETFLEELAQIGAQIELWRLALAFIAVLAGFAVRTTLLERLLRPFAAVASRTSTKLDDQALAQIKRPLGWLINLLGFYLAAVVLRPPPGLLAALLLVLHTVGIVFVAWMLYNAVEVISLALNQFTQRTESQMDDQLVPLVKKILRVAIVIVTLVMIVQQWGYNVTSLIAGLGLGGLAFALAAQSTLANLFGSIMIFTDRPFTVGDWIKSEHGEGVVEEIGLRSTRVRTFSKSIISIPNADVASSPVENFSQMTLRRIKTTLALTYATTPAQMEFIVEGIKRLILDDEEMFHESFYVNFVEFGASSLDVMVYCFTRTTAWGEYMDVRQRLYLNIMRLVQEAGSSFAFPSRSLYLETPLARFEELAPGGFAMPEEPLHVRDFALSPRSARRSGDDGSMGETRDGMSS